MSKTETTKAALKRLANEGKPYRVIADALNAAGHVTRGNGVAWSTKSVSSELLAMGIRRRIRGPKKENTSTETRKGRGSKWDVLRSIDDCADFKPATKKALIRLLMQEIYS